MMRKVGTLIRKYVSAPIVALIKKLNENLRGWANYICRGLICNMPKEICTLEIQYTAKKWQFSLTTATVTFTFQPKL